MIKLRPFIFGLPVMNYSEIESICLIVKGNSIYSFEPCSRLFRKIDFFDFRKFLFTKIFEINGNFNSLDCSSKESIGFEEC